MATMYFSETVDVSAAQAWKVIGGYATAESRLFSAASDARIEQWEASEGFPAGTYRIVTVAADGSEIPELIIGTDEKHMRTSYTVPGLFGADHHSASMQVIPVDEGSCRVEWVTDVLPDSFAAEYHPYYVGNFADIVKAVKGEELTGTWSLDAAKE